MSDLRDIKMPLHWEVITHSHTYSGRDAASFIRTKADIYTEPNKGVTSMNKCTGAHIHEYSRMSKRQYRDKNANHKLGFTLTKKKSADVCMVFDDLCFDDAACLHGHASQTATCFLIKGQTNAFPPITRTNNEPYSKRSKM